MRITNNIIATQAIRELQSQTRSLEDARHKAATGQMVARPSDDPIAGAGIMQSSSGLRALEQYTMNLEAGQSRLALEESVLDQITASLERAREVATSQAGDPATAATRRTARAEIDRLIEFVASLGNAQLAGTYVFGGHYADSPPFQNGVPDPLRPPGGSLPIEVGAGILVETNHSAQEIFLDSDVLDSLRALSNALDLNDPLAIQSSIGRIDTAFDAVQELVGDLGGRAAYMDSAISNLESLEVALQTFRSGLADADLAEAMTELVNRQTSLQAAMVANSRLLEVTLADYLR